MAERYLVANARDGVQPPPNSERIYGECRDCGSEVYWTVPKGEQAPSWVHGGVVVCGACALYRLRQGEIDLSRGRDGPDPN